MTNYFRIVARGDFDPDRFLQRSPLRGARVWHRGDKIADSSTRATDHGIEIILGDGPDLDFREQQSIAHGYLAAHATALKKLIRTPGVASSYLGIQDVVYPDSAGSIIDVSPTLMQQALKIGLQLTIWSCLSPQPFFRKLAPAKAKARKSPRAKSKRRSRTG